MNVPEELQYTETHEWVKQDGDVYLCGITDYAQNELSDIVFVELPDVGKQVAQGDALCVVESVKAASDIYAPVSLTVVEVNEALESEPDLVNTDPYGDGWLCKVTLTKPAEAGELLSADQYTSQLEGEE